MVFWIEPIAPLKVPIGVTPAIIISALGRESFWGRLYISGTDSHVRGHEVRENAFANPAHTAPLAHVQGGCLCAVRAH